jgi:hypothetical protein
MMLAGADGHAAPQFFVGAGSNETGGLKPIRPAMERGGHQDRVIGKPE